MPNAVVKSYAEKTGKSPEHIEGWWKQAEKDALKKFPKKGPHYWAYVNGIVKKRGGIKEVLGFKDFVNLLSEVDDDFDDMEKQHDRVESDYVEGGMMHHNGEEGLNSDMMHYVLPWIAKELDTSVGGLKHYMPNDFGAGEHEHEIWENINALHGHQIKETSFDQTPGEDDEGDAGATWELAIHESRNPDMKYASILLNEGASTYNTWVIKKTDLHKVS